VIHAKSLFIENREDYTHLSEQQENP